MFEYTFRQLWALSRDVLPRFDIEHPGLDLPLMQVPMDELLVLPKCWLC